MAKDQAVLKRQAQAASGVQSYPKVIAVTSGKGGVGKTNVVGNLAVALSRQGLRVVIIDADVGLANVDILFDLRPEYNIRHVISTEKTLKDVMIETEHGVKIIPGGSGFADLTQLTEGEKLTLLGEFETLAEEADFILVDTGAGISSNVLYFNSACDECLVIATTEPTSITDAYALMKVMSQKYGTRRFRLVVNMVDTEADAKRVYSSLSNALTKFLKNVVLEYAGCIPFDRKLQRAVQKRSLLLDKERDSQAGNALEKLAQDLIKNKDRKDSTGNLTFFMNRVLHAET